MDEIVIGTIIAFLATFYTIPVIIRAAEWKQLFDVPDERKLHRREVSSLGGLGMFIGFTLSLLFVLDFSIAPQFQYYFAAFLVIFFLGIKDDILVISPLKKILGQIVVAGILVFKADVLISDMHGFLGLNAIPPFFSVLISMFTIIVVINAFNLIDGVDGLAGSVALISCTSFAVIFYLNDDLPFAIMGFIAVGSILAFLIYNFYPAKIFMGDTGAMLLGLVNVMMAIRFIETGINYHNTIMQSTPAMGFGILMIPLLDTLRVFGLRIMRGKSPFIADKCHLHHLLLDRGWGHIAITLIISGLSLLFALITYFCLPMGTTVVILAQASIFFVGISILQFTKPKVEMHVITDEEEKQILEDARVRKLFMRFSKTSDKTEE